MPNEKVTWKVYAESTTLNRMFYDTGVEFAFAPGWMPFMKATTRTMQNPLSFIVLA